MDEHRKDTIFLTGEVCEIIQKEGNNCQLRVLCKPEYLLLECNSDTDIHFGEKVLLKLKFEAKDILPYINNAISDTN